MLKKYKLSKILFISIFSFILLFGSMGFFISNSSTALAQTAGLNIEVLVRKKSESISPNTINSSSGEIYSYDWEKVSKIKITLTDANITNDNVSLKIECLKEYASTELDYDSSDRSYIEEITGSVQNKTFSYEYDIDNGESKTIESVSTSIKGWGIYRFSIAVGEQTFISSLYEIKPSTDIVDPIFRVKTQSGSETHKNLVCSIVNTSDFKYADTSKITWYVEGVDKDNKRYCLTPTDRYSSTTEALYEIGEIDRTGLNFTFNPQIKGKWTIYCVYKPEGTSGIQSDSIIIDDNQNFNTTTFFICLSAVAVGSCGIIALWQFIKTKKEKVW